MGATQASVSVTGATGNVEPLPNYIHTINAALTDIDTSLKPIRGQVADATASLVSIRGTAQSIDASLKDTSASLINTSGSLVNTSGVLVSVDQTGAAIDHYFGERAAAEGNHRSTARHSLQCDQ